MSRNTWNLAIAAAVAFVLASAGTLFAALTFHQGPTFVQVGSGAPYTFNLFADISGMGNTPVEGTILITADVQYECQNKGGKIVPGRNPVPLVTEGSQELDPADHNGRGTLDLTVALEVPETVDASRIGCPNGNWIGINPVVTGPVTASATITFQGATVFTGGPLVAQ